MEIENIKNKCVGCMACLGECPVKCISSVLNDEGFYYPQIDHDLCVKCGKCAKVCPVISPLKMNQYRESYYGKSKDSDILQKSTSGGAFYHLATKIINQGGNVYGAFFDCDEKRLKCTSSDEVGLENLLKSKYIESSMSVAIDKIKEDLKKGRKVLFCGTPCEAAGIRKLFNNDNLVIVDFICHGVPSSKLFHEHLLHVAPKGKLLKVDFRPKDKGWDSKNIRLEIKTKTKTKTTPYYLDTFYSGFMTHNAFLRESCYECQFRKNHLSDITIADFWGYKKTDIGEEYAKSGLSMIIANTPKGSACVKQLDDNFNIREMSNVFSDYAFADRDYKQAHKLRNNFYVLYNKKGFEYAAKHTYMKDYWKLHLKYKIKRLIGKNND